MNVDILKSLMELLPVVETTFLHKKDIMAMLFMKLCNY